MSDENLFDSDEMKAAGLELREKLYKAFENLADALAEGPEISSVDSWGWNDPKTHFSVYCDLPDGSTGIWVFEPGKPVKYVIC